MEFREVETFIKWVEQQKRFSKKVSLDKMKYLCKIFGNPEQKFLSIHVSGTNGKGSTVAMLKKVLQKAGLKVGTFTSPYITCFNERIGFDDHFISDDDLLSLANYILTKYPKITSDGFELPTFFEFITLLAFLYFEKITNLDVAIIEVGIGGRLDATNVIKPCLSFITNVAYDHMEVLGNTLEAILTEKLGITKEKVPLIAGLKDEKLKAIALKKAHDLNTIAIFPSYEKLKINKCDNNTSIFSYRDFLSLKLNLHGYHQIENALLVLEAFPYLQKIFKVSKKALIDGLEEVTWVGRFEKISDEYNIYVDGCHNIDGITRICDFIKSLNYQTKRAVVAISHDKALKQMIKKLDETFDEIIFTNYSYARSASCEELNKLSNNPHKKQIASLEMAIKEVLDHPRDFTIFLGSLYLVSDVYKLFPLIIK